MGAEDIKKRKKKISARQMKELIAKLELTRAKQFQCLSEKNYALLAKSYRKTKQFERGEAVIAEGRELYPKGKRIIAESARYAVVQKKWRVAVAQYDALIRLKRNRLSEKQFAQFIMACSRGKCLLRVREIAEIGLAQFPDSILIPVSAGQAEMTGKEWARAIPYWQDASNKEPDNAEHLLQLSILHRLTERHDLAREYFNQYFQLNKNPPVMEEMTSVISSGHERVVIFNNKKTRIDFYKKLTPAEEIFITFDSINTRWSRPPFAFKLLQKMPVDLICVRKSDKMSCLQDLSIADFVNAVKPIISGYSKVTVYGTSLGGYASLYFGSGINCNIVAIAPRNPGHPIYGMERYQVTCEFRHDYRLPTNHNNHVTIIFDPKNRMDEIYVQNEGVLSSSSLTLMRFPFGGHTVATHLLTRGILKKVAMDAFSKTSFMQYPRSTRQLCYRFLTNLAAECVVKNKFVLGMRLLNKAAELFPNEQEALRALNTALTRSIKERTLFSKDVVIPKLCFVKCTTAPSGRMLSLVTGESASKSIG